MEVLEVMRGEASALLDKVAGDMDNDDLTTGVPGKGLKGVGSFRDIC